METINPIHQVSCRMLEIERINAAYNMATQFGQYPNGQEAAIDALLTEWDTLKVCRLKLKHNHA